ncbi:hypothetical protein L1987_81019 [Smallanthus sonchifolius]|uniref:Uncharacterized protein n=1 Tax=Smallanthus sonchifolius TaxID=185202 RepID=A0ACB8YQV5_9ASTR|nr:hypothetical protein L1987_81019 [Smallanthus sonchifolius]
MSHTVKSLFNDFGVNPTVYELNEIARGREIEQALSGIGCSTVPIVFIGGELVGGANEITNPGLRLPSGVCSNTNNTMDVPVNLSLHDRRPCIP